MAQHRVDFIQGAHLFQHGFLALQRLVDQARIGQAFHGGTLGAAVHELHGIGQDGHAHHGVFQMAQPVQFIHQLLLGWQEFVDGRIQQTDRHRSRCHDLEDALEVLALHRQQLVQCLLPVFGAVGDDHLDDNRQPFRIVEHALGAAQADPHGTVFQCPVGVLRRVGVGHDLQTGGLVRPAQQGLEFRGKVRLDHGDLAEVDIAGGAVDGDQVALADGVPADKGLAHLHVDVDALGAGDTGFAHAPRDHRGVRRLAAAGCQDALGGKKTVDVFRLGLLAQQDDALSSAPLLFGAVGIEDRVSDCRAGRGRQAARHRCMRHGRVQPREQQLLEHIRLDAQQCLLPVDETLAGHVHRGANQCRGIHLAVAGLQAVEAPLLDGEFEVLHLPVMGLQPLAQRLQFLVHVGHLFLQIVDRPGRADARYHVLALGVDQVFAEQPVFAGIGVAREAHAGRAVLAEVAEHHGDQVDRGTVGHVRGDVEFAPVVDRAPPHPGVEDGLDGDFQLLHRIIREGLAGLALHHVEEAVGDLAQVAGRECDVLRDAGLVLDRLELGIEGLVGYAQGHLAEQLDEAPVGIPAEAFVAGLGDEALQGVDVESQVEDGVHHAGHGHGRTRADRHQQRVVAAAEGLAGFLLQRLHLVAHLVHDAGGQFMVGMVEVIQAGLRADDETGRHIDPDLGHFAQVGALAAEQHLVAAVTFLECENVLLGTVHRVSPGHTGLSVHGTGTGCPV